MPRIKRENLITLLIGVLVFTISLSGAFCISSLDTGTSQDPRNLRHLDGAIEQ